LFAAKYKNLYTSVAYNDDELNNIRADIETDISQCASVTDFIITADDIRQALTRLKAHKNDGNFCLSSDHFVNAGPDLSVHIAFLFTAIVTHGYLPRDFVTSTVIPIPKKRNGNMADSENFRGIALSSVFGKIFDNVILHKYHDKLNTSDLQFGFKQQSSTNMCTMVLKETISYYSSNHSSVYCTFLDASKAFDRVNFCKLFRLLIKRGLPACIVRTLINMYTGHLIRVSWAGVMSNYFTALNGVKQGGVVSPILFCIYIDDLLLSLARSGVGCYIGLNFVGAIAYADDIVLISPTPFAMRRLLSICDDYALQYDIIFNASKSKFLVIVASRWRCLSNVMNECVFFIGGKPIEKVVSYPHLGHLICSNFDEREDIRNRRNKFIGQVNNFLCFFSKLNLVVKIKLFCSYCSSIYGCEIWPLDSCFIEEFCSTWRSALRRLLGLPYRAHSFLLPILTCTLPIFDEICMRSSRFVSACLSSRSALVRFVSLHGVLYGRFNSILGKNVLFCCKRYNWFFEDFVLGLVDLKNVNFRNFCLSKLEFNQLNDAFSLLELLMLREGYLLLSDFMSIDDIKLMILCVSTN